MHLILAGHGKLAQEVVKYGNIKKQVSENHRSVSGR